MGNQFNRSRNKNQDDNFNIQVSGGLCDESEAAHRLRRLPTHVKCQRSNDQLCIGFELFTYRGGAPPYRGFHWCDDDVISLPVNCSWDDLCQLLKSKIDESDSCDLTIEIYQGTYKEESCTIVYEAFRDPVVKPPAFSVEKTFLQNDFHLRILKPMDRDMEDIGVFVQINQTKETSFPSLCSQSSFSCDDIQMLLASLGRNRELTHNFSLIPRPKSLMDHSMSRMKDYCDFKLSDNGMSGNLDLQIPISRDELRGFVGDNCLEELDGLFGTQCEDIVLRRCDKKDHCIDFHVDYARRTMQIALTGDEEYEGGRLVYVSREGKLEEPRREAGWITIHDGGVIHGVTGLRQGVRYGLLILARSISLAQ